MAAALQRVESDFHADTNRAHLRFFIFIAVKKEVLHIGIAVVDSDTFKLQIAEFRDDSGFATLESCLLQHRPGSCTLHVPNTEDAKLGGNKSLLQKKVGKLMEACGVNAAFSSRKDGGGDLLSDEALEVLQKDLERLLLPTEKALLHGVDLSSTRLASRALHCLIEAEGLLTSPCNYRQFTLTLLAIDALMRLDKAAFISLSILPGRGDNMRSATSLLGLLNKCKTAFGTQLLVSWLTQPSMDIATIRQRHDVVEVLVKHENLRRSLQHRYLRRLPNLNRILSRFHRVASLEPGKITLSACSLEDVVALSDGLLEVQGIVNSLENSLNISDVNSTSHTAVTDTQIRTGVAQTIQKRYVTPLREALVKMQKFRDLVEYTIDAREAECGRYVINRSFDPYLGACCDERDKIEEAMLRLRRQVESHLGLGPGKEKKGKGADVQSVKLMECNTNGFVFRVTKKDQKTVQAHKSAYRQVRINKADYQFTSRELMALVEQFTAKSREVDKGQLQLAQKTISAASSYWSVVETLASTIAAIDVCCAFAEVATSSVLRYVRPLMIETENGEEEVIELKGMRHPLVEIQMMVRRPGAPITQGSATGGGVVNLRLAEFVKNDVELNHSRRRLHIITGPNMGGKSTYIRSVAIVCLLAQAGCFVPCDEARLSTVDSIMCRVGASDDHMKGVSTFFSEMIQTSTILQAATRKSLVLIDELGRGTSTNEGFGLAWEIAKSLATEVKCLTLFATHFHELGELAAVTDVVVNSQLTADVVVIGGEGGEKGEDMLRFGYQVVPGCADQSYGVHVARMAGIPKDVVDRAAIKTKELEAVEDECLAGGNRERNSGLQTMWQSLQKILDGAETPLEFSTKCLHMKEDLKVHLACEA